MAAENYISGTDTLERLARLETKVHLKFAELDKAIILAANNVEKEKNYTREQNADHFKLVNNFQARMDKMSEAFAVKHDVHSDLDRMKLAFDDKLELLKSLINNNTKLIYIGVGILLCLEVILRFLVK
jgi:hypothetical protein